MNLKNLCAYYPDFKKKLKELDRRFKESQDFYKTYDKMIQEQWKVNQKS